MTYDTLATDAVIEKTRQGLKSRSFESTVVATRSEALELIKTFIPAGASVMNGASRTLEEIGFIEYLKSGAHGWDNLHAKVLAEKDPQKQALLRKQSVLSDYYLGSVHAVAETGEIVIASNTGSQLPHIVYTSPNLIFVIGTQKITPTLEDAFARVQEHVIPLEDARMMSVYQSHTALNKELILRGDPAFLGRTIRVIFVKEKLGF